MVFRSPSDTTFPTEILGQLSDVEYLRACDNPVKSIHGKAEKCMRFSSESDVNKVFVFYLIYFFICVCDKELFILFVVYNGKTECFVRSTYRGRDC